MPACINMNEIVAFSRVIIGMVWCLVPPSGHVVLRLLEFSLVARFGTSLAWFGRSLY
ncbi:hypothetical protein BDV38DRAFT_243491 [Aspergillus pseudotamarii]|uniref:Uncharacterized protein n=1 Tax=Aspergillus pseudotamarii TaxID=132259 RepID=A0A5N6SZ71_ASPPS|nr:uncharacterized protein BDV38DRAFT_243491 [Aspergillus pseudotamarii]KAE8139040.1 hypothetical protein BDV38DRAFT_243491 [Aspergillus pseudotamarii]